MKYSIAFTATLGLIASTVSAAPTAGTSSSLSERDLPPRRIEATSKDPNFWCWCQTPPNGLNTPVSCTMMLNGGDDSGFSQEDTTGNCILPNGTPAATPKKAVAVREVGSIAKRDLPPRRIEATSKNPDFWCWCQTPPGGLNAPVSCTMMLNGGDDSGFSQEDTTGNCILPNGAPAATPKSVSKRDLPPRRIEATSKNPDFWCWCQTPPNGLNAPVTCTMMLNGGDDSGFSQEDTTGNCVLPNGTPAATPKAATKRDLPPRRVEATSKDPNFWCWCQTPPGPLNAPVTCTMMLNGGDDSGFSQQDTTGNCVLTGK